MKRMKSVFLSIALVGTSALVVYPLFAHCGHCAADGKTIVEQLDKGKLTLAKAVTAAEQHSKGRAISVISELNDEHKLAMEVYCIVSDSTGSGSASAAPKIMKCQIDGATGTVSEMKEAKEFPTTEDDDKPGASPGMGGAGGRGGAGAGGASGGAGGRGGAGSGTKPGGTAMNITNKTVDAACGVCVYKMEGQNGCPLAVKIDGKAYIVEGAKWPNHDYCDHNCQAVVSGTIEGDKFVATSLKPAS
jgi:hypothetical protein